ncbi:NAD(P)-binding protein [Atractiella rhizophila]|nr:NAD(P)-binding protein [Atractiella rhizophila]
MVLSSDPSAPLVAITGITGRQDTKKQTSVEWKGKGVEMVAVNLVVGNEDAVRKSLEGAEIVFLMTNFWEHGSAERETQEGKMVVDIAYNLSTLKLFIWSGLPSYKKISNGKYTHVAHADGKEEVSVFLAEKSATTRIPYAVVQSGFYIQSFAQMVQPRHGKLAFSTNPDTAIPFFDIREFGLFVRAAIEQPEKAGTVVNVFADARTLYDAAKDLEEVTGRPFEYVQVPVRESEFAKHFPEQFLLQMEQNLAAWDEFGYFGTKQSEVNPALKDTKLTTWKEWAKQNKDQFM